MLDKKESTSLLNIMSSKIHKFRSNSSRMDVKTDPVRIYYNELKGKTEFPIFSGRNAIQVFNTTMQH